MHDSLLPSHVGHFHTTTIPPQHGEEDKEHYHYHYHSDHCGKEFTEQVLLKAHFQSVHKCVQYPCDLCNYQATTMGCLQKHIKSKHEGIKFPCDQYDQQFTGKGHLKKHIQTYNVQTSVIKSQMFLLFEFIFENFFTSGPS